MATISVPRAELAALVGLSPDVDDATLKAAIERTVTQRKTHEAAVARATAEAHAEGRLQDEDRRIVAAAVNDGRVSAQRAQFWLDALQRDRAANRAVIASLAPGLKPAQRVAADADLERVHGRLMASLGVPVQPRNPVAAANDFGGAMGTPGLASPPGFPAPVRLVRGKDPQQWTKQERDDAALWALGPAFRKGLTPPPGGAGYYHPSPNDHAFFDETTGEWHSKDGWERGLHGRRA